MQYTHAFLDVVIFWFRRNILSPKWRTVFAFSHPPPEESGGSQPPAKRWAASSWSGRTQCEMFMEEKLGQYYLWGWLAEFNLLQM